MKIYLNRLKRIIAIVTAVVALSTVTSAPVPASAATPLCSDAACQGIPTTKQAVATLLVQMFDTGSPGRLTTNGYPALMVREIRPIAKNNVAAICDVDLRSLQTIAIVVKKFGSANVTDLNRHCAEDPDVDCNGLYPSPVHCKAVPTIAVDFDRIGGMGAGVAMSQALLNFVPQFAPDVAGGTWAENNCESASHPLMTRFPSALSNPCTHQHIDFRGAGNTQLNIPSSTLYQKTPWASDIYAVSDASTHLLTQAEWLAAGSPSPSVVNLIANSRVFKRYDDPSIIYVQAGDGPVHQYTAEEWVAAGSPTPQFDGADFNYQKTPWSDNIYFSEDRRNWSLLTADEYAAAGSHPPATTGFIAGSRVFRVSGDAAGIYVSTGNGPIHKYSLAEWQLAGSPSPTFTASFQKAAWSSNIYYVEGSVSRLIDQPEWESAGSPSPAVVPLVANSQVFSIAGAPGDIFVRAGNGPIHKFNSSQLQAAGSPAPAYTAIIEKTTWSADLYLTNGTITERLTPADLQEIGTPPYSVVSSVANSARFRVTGDSSGIYVVAGDGPIHKYTSVEWGALGAQPPTATAQFQRSTWSPTIYFVLGGTTRIVSAAEWSGLSSPPFTTTPLVTNSLVYRFSGSAEIYVKAGDGPIHHMTPVEYGAAGQPAPQDR